MAKSYGHLFEKIADPATLESALKRAAKGKNSRATVMRFLSESEAELSLLR